MDEEQWINRNSLIERGKRARRDRSVRSLIDLLHAELESEDIETESQEVQDDERLEGGELTDPPSQSPKR